MDRAKAASGCTLRGLAVGTVGCLMVGAGFQYCPLVLGVWAFAGWHYTVGANLMLFVMALLVNPVLGLVRRSWVLTPAELTQVYVMWIVSSAVSTTGLVSYLLPHITTLAYYASPENQWAEKVLPYVPDWVIPSKDADLVKGFYEGRGDGDVPWALWLPVLLAWAPMVMSLYIAMISVVVILRKQWVDHERLVYPMMQLPISMIQDDGQERPGLIKPLFRNWLFWLGVSVPFIIGINNGLARYFPIDYIHVGGTYLYIFRDTVKVIVGINFMMIGFAYFVRRDVILGLCFFFLLYVIYQIVSTIQGGGEYDPLISHWSQRGPANFVFQGLGAFFALIGVGLWNARQHPLRVLRQTIGAAGYGEGEDDGEIMSYRGAVIASVGSLSFMTFWMWSIGLPAWVAPLYLLIAFILYLGITRIVAEGGIPWFVPPIIASDAIAGVVGTRALGPEGIVALGFTYAWACDMIIVVMACAANGLKVVEETVRQHRRLLFWSIMIALVVTLGGAVTIMLDASYEYGGLNISHTFKEQGFYQWEDAALRVSTMTDPNWEYVGHTAFGALLMGLLMLARQRLLWWPFHPIAFPVSLYTSKMFLSLLIAWTLKSAALGYGGPRLYRTLRPFFLGLIMGEWLPIGLMAVYEWVRQNV